MSIGIRPIEQMKARRDLRQFLPESVDLYRPTTSRTATGGTTSTLAVHSSGPGRVSPMGIEAESRWLDRLGTSQGWVITLHSDRDVRITDQLRIGSRRFEVIGYDQDRSYPMTQRVMTREVSI